MASIKIDDLSSVKPFDPHGDPSSVGRRWQRWMKSISLHADSKGLIIQADKDDNKAQRRALLLHSAGEDVQEIFETLADTGGIKDYGKAEKALNDYFIPKVNSTYQNHVFRSMEQHDGETVAQFVTRLRQVVKDCDYDEQVERGEHWGVLSTGISQKKKKNAKYRNNTISCRNSMSYCNRYTVHLIILEQITRKQKLRFRNVGFRQNKQKRNIQ